MVARYAMEWPAADLAGRYSAEQRITLGVVEADLYGRPGYNLDGTALVPVVVRHDDRRLLVRHWWGLMPQWSRWPPGEIATSLDAREAWSSARYGPLVRHQRCILPATRFYVFLHGGDWPTDIHWHPWAVERVDGDLLHVAGIWATWRDPESGFRMVCAAMLTRPPRLPMAHGSQDATPLVLIEDQLAAWLNPQTDRAVIHAMLTASPLPILRAYRLTDRLINPQHDDSSLIEPLRPGEEWRSDCDSAGFPPVASSTVTDPTEEEPDVR